MPRPLTLEQARARYPHRYTMEHVPSWARHPAEGGLYYAPQFRTDSEWYANTLFPGEGGLQPGDEYCHCTGQTWPLGQWLEKPFQRG